MKNMNITKYGNGIQLYFLLEGRLDTITAPQLEKELNGSLDGIKELVFDLKDLDYLSSAGLRVFLGAQKIMSKQGSMKMMNVNETISEIFEVTGFADILSIEG